MTQKDIKENYYTDDVVDGAGAESASPSAGLERGGPPDQRLKHGKLSPQQFLPTLIKTVGAKSTLKRARISSNGGGLVLKTFLGFVLAPAVFVLIYYSFIASDIYVAEGKLTVRESYEPEGNSASFGNSSISAIAGKIGLGTTASTSQDSTIIMDYLKSRSAIVDAGGRDMVASLYDRPEIDWFSRLDSSDDLESIWRYWKSHVTVYVDSLSNILTLRVRGYSPEDALRLARELMQRSEHLINDISRRNREDALSRARNEVDRAMVEIVNVRAQILAFQKSSKSVDPQMTAKQIMTLIADLTLKKIELESILSSAESIGATNRPSDKVQKTALEVINKQILDLEGKLTGTDPTSLASQLREYELLKLKEQFAEQLYTIARSSYEEARRKLNRQQLYVAIIVPPILPDSAVYPKPLQEASVIFLALLVIWAISCLLVATIRDSAQSA
ncbi:hypothetical protein [Ensifer sp. MJa1]|uniref:hypothetical protein n=1 Tax=Ensifer sp. MJa1 TaxID=2919888 RepID=UPI00300A9D03